MTDIMNVVRERRSIRKFDTKEVSEEQLNTLLEAAQYAQSWANTQCWEIIIVRDQKIRTELRETILKGNPATRAIEDAPLLLATCAKLKSSGYYSGEAPTKFGDWFMFDMGIVNQNLCLAAHAMGLGSVVVGLLDHDKAKKILRVPEGYELVTLIPIGYPAKAPQETKRREIETFLHQDTF